MDFSNHHLNKHNDNVSKNLTNNGIDNDEKKVDLIALKLVDKLNNPGGRLFYCKVAWRLPEARIWDNLEVAQMSGRDPKKYFSWLCKRELEQL